VNGRRVSLGVKGRENQPAAVAAWHRLMAGVPTVPRAAVPTVAEVIAAFLADAEARVQPITLAFYRRFLEPFAAKHGDLRTDAVTIPHAEAFARKPTWSTSTRHDALGTLATCFRWAERCRIIGVSPLRGIRLPPKESQGAEAVIGEPDYRRMVAASAGDFQALIRFLWHTGCRPSEATGLTVEAVDWESACIVLRRHKTAHRGLQRVLYLTPDALAVLTCQRERHRSGLLFRHEGGGAFGRKMLAQKFWRLSKRLGVRLTAYSFRHTWACAALARGVPDAIVAELLGHRGTNMLHKHYAHLSSRAAVLRDAASRVR
jgi:integrase